MYRLKSILLLLLLLCSVTATAQRFPFFNLKVENGLVQSQATCLTQDQQGNLWIGTLGGLSRYDGKRVVNYTVSDGLLSNIIIDVLAVVPGLLYVSTAEGLQVFDGNKFREIKDDKGLSFKSVTQIVQADKGQMYLLLNTGLLSRLDSKNNKVYPVPVPERLLTVYFRNKELKVASELGVVYVLDEQNNYTKTDSFRSTDPQMRVLRIFEDSKGTCWLLGNKGLYRIAGKQIEASDGNGKQGINQALLNAAEDREGQLWFTSSSGVFRKRENQVTKFDHENGLTNNIVWDILCDQEGNIWMSSDGEGLFRYSGGPFVSIGESSGLKNKQVTGIAGDTKGTMYFSSYEGRLYTYQIGEQVRAIAAPELHNDAITGIVWQHDAGLWVGTRNRGLFRMQAGRLVRFDFTKYVPGSGQISALFSDQYNNILAGVKEGVLCIDKTGAVVFHELKNSTPVAFTEIGEDSTLIATRLGFWLLSANKVARWNKGYFTDSIPVQCMCSDDQYLYIGTSEGGIVAYDRQQRTRMILNSKNGLSSDFIYNIIKDESGNIWAGTGRGICKITKTKSGRFFIRLYGKDNGVIGLESNSNASFADKTGRIWFGTTEGVSCYSPDARPVRAHPTHIVLESVKLFGGKNIDTRFFAKNSGWYNIPEQLRLPYKHNNISFSFQAITLSPVDKILYRYILEGSGRNWSEWSEENTINFLGLDPGKYVLKVMCKINGQVQHHVMLSYSFVIKTPFHKSIWFVVSIFVLAILLGVYLQYAANKRKLKRSLREDALRKEEQSRVRERTAEDFHDEVGNKLTRINVLTNVLRSKLDSSDNAEAGRIIQQIQDNSQQLYSGTRDILWSLQPSNDNLYEILHHVRDLAAELFSETDIRFSISGNEESFREYKMPLDKSRNFIMIWKEALNNCMKYSNAGRVLFQISRIGDAIQVRLVDNGAGFDPLIATQGNGLKNMRTRAARLDAGFEIVSKKGQGTQVILTLKDTNK